METATRLLKATEDYVVGRKKCGGNYHILCVGIDKPTFDTP